MGTLIFYNIQNNSLQDSFLNLNNTLRVFLWGIKHSKHLGQFTQTIVEQLRYECSYK